MGSKNRLRIAIVGAGLGGAVAGKLLQDAGYSAELYEQAPSVSRLGAGIHLGPNAMRVLNHIGVGKYISEHGVQPPAWISRKLETGETLFRLPLGQTSIDRYGAPYVTIHRGDLHVALTAALDPTKVHFGKQLINLRFADAEVRLDFADGTHVVADFVIGADGLNSKVRETLLGIERPIFTGVAGHRTTIPIERLKGMQIADLTKWFGVDRYTLVYFLTSTRDEVYVVTGCPLATWDSEASWVESNPDDLRAALRTADDELQRIVAEADGEVTKWGFFSREPLPFWSRGPIVLVGDACHPMKPTMAQGAAMAMEDAAMLVRCMHEADDLTAAIRLYEANRRDRTHKVQTISGYNTWLRAPMDPSWAFAYDVFSAPLLAEAA
jgi:6-hydroxynicotinate 3-monooxygenase